MYVFNCLSNDYFNYLNFNASIDLSTNSSILYATLAPAPTYYNLNNGVLFRIYPRTPSNLANKNADPFIVTLDCSKVYHNTNIITSNKYNNDQFTGLVASELQYILEWSIQNWVDPILQAWATLDDKPKPYPAGSWGPAASSALMARDGLTWFEESWACILF